MRGGIPNRPTGTGKWAAFDQAVWDELFGGGGKWMDSPTVKVQDTSSGRWLDAKIGAGGKFSSIKPGWYFVNVTAQTTPPHAQADFDNALADAISIADAVDFNVPPHSWLNNISSDPRYWGNFTNTGLPTTPDYNSNPTTIPPKFWQYYLNGATGCGPDYGDSWCNRTFFPFQATYQRVTYGARLVGNADAGVFAGLFASGTIGTGGFASCTRWRLVGYAPSALDVSIINGQSYLADHVLSDGLDEPNLSLESHSFLAPSGHSSKGSIYDLDGVSVLSPVAIPSATVAFFCVRGQFAYTDGFGSLAPPAATDATVNVTSNPSNTSVAHGSAASFSCAGTIPSGLGYTLLFQWLYSADSGVTWNSISTGNPHFSTTGDQTANLSVTPSDTVPNGWLFKCRLFTKAGMANTTSATLTVT